MIATFRPAAEQELLKAITWYLNDGGPLVADEFESAVQHALQLLTFMPRLGTTSYLDTRIWPLKPFAYSLVYRLIGGELVVLAVAHQRRAAGYWRTRR